MRMFTWTPCNRTSGFVDSVIILFAFRLCAYLDLAISKRKRMLHQKYKHKPYKSEIYRTKNILSTLSYMAELSPLLIKGTVFLLLVMAFPQKVQTKNNTHVRQNKNYSRSACS